MSCSGCGRQDVVIIDDGAFPSTLGLEIDAGGDCRHWDFVVGTGGWEIVVSPEAWLSTLRNFVVTEALEAFPALETARIRL